MDSRFTAPKRPEKISDQIIAQIRDIILAGDLKPGDKLGSEKELIAQFGVSKATLREALRVLEAMGLVEIRKGLAGGVFIAEVDMKTTIHSIINFLHFKAVSIKDITMLRYFVEPFIVRIAAQNATEQDIQKLKVMISNEIDEPRPSLDLNKQDIKKGISFHRYLARLTHNPILILIMDFVDNLLSDMKSQLHLGEEFYDRVKKSHGKVLDCLIKKDLEGAERELTADILSVGHYMAEMAGTPHFDPAMLGQPPRFLHLTSQFEELIDISRLLNDNSLFTDPNQRLVLRHVGTGNLYVLLLKQGKGIPENKNSSIQK